MTHLRTRRLVSALGLREYARRVVLFLSGSERTIKIAERIGVFLQHDFGDYIELNQIGAERDVIAQIRREVLPSDVFLDVGSNIGTYAVFVGGILTTGTVIAVEPIESTAAKLARNLEANDIEAEICNVAFSDTDGTAVMTTPDSHGSSSIDPSEGSELVTCVRGDEYLSNEELPSPTIVKIDVEGHELSVLDGLEDTLSRSSCRLVYCEVHAEDIVSSETTVDAVQSRLEEHGFATRRCAELEGARCIVRGERQ